jgi:hypothetical protein
MKNWLEIAKTENEKFNESEFGKLSDGKVRHWDAAVRGGITSGNKNKKNGVLAVAGKVSAKKQWKENREGELKKSSKGGKIASKLKKGVHALSKKELSKAGKKGFANGLGNYLKKKK